MDSNYINETYATYSAYSFPSKMTFDNLGNLYVVHPNIDKVVKVDTQKVASNFYTTGTPEDAFFATGSDYPNQLFILENYKLTTFSSDETPTTFASFGYPFDGGMSVTQAPQGTYGGDVYFGTSGYDRLGRIDENGNVSQFTSWPGSHNNGAVSGMEFDPSGLFGNSLYVATVFDNHPEISGIFSVDAQGNANRFPCSLVKAKEVIFDSTGTYFTQDMFVYGAELVENDYSLWRVSPSGITSEIIQGTMPAMAFGLDGALYVSEIDYDAGLVTISRIVPVPEPLTLSLLALGGLTLRRR